MNFKLVFFIIFLLTGNVSAQTPVFDWVQNYSGYSGSDVSIVTDITSDVKGNTYSTGFFLGNIDFDPGPAINTLVAKGLYGDGFITKTSPSGKLIWVKQLASDEGVSISSIIADETGSVFTCGVFNGNMDCDPGPGKSILSSTLNSNFIIKLDTSGKFIWSKAIMNTSGHMGLLQMIMDQKQNLLLRGSFSGGKPDMDPGSAVVNLAGSSCGGDEHFILKLDHNGNYIWVKRAGERCNPIIIKDIAVDSKDNIYIAGTVFGTQDFDPDTGKYILSSAGSYDLFIAKLDSNGKFLKAVSAGSMRTDNANGVTIDKADNIYITGVYADEIDFDPGPDSLILRPSGASSNNIFIAKYNAGLALTWAKNFSVPSGMISGYGQGSKIVVDNYCNITTLGLFSGQFDFDPGPDTVILKGSENIFLSRYDSSGNFVWAGQLSGAGSEDFTSLHGDAFDNLYTGSTFFTKADFDPSADTTFITPIAYDGFIHKLSICYPYDTVDIIACRSYTLEGHKYDTPGTYTQLITTERKCTLTLTFTLTLDEVNDTVLRSGNILSAKGTGTAYQWVRCPSFVPIPGATASVFTAVSDGDYALIITQGSCTDTSDCISVIRTGLTDLATDQPAVQLKPNPTYTKAILSFPEAVQHAAIELKTITGISLHHRADFNGTEISFDLQEYPAGIYLVSIKSPDHSTITLKLVKQ